MAAPIDTAGLSPTLEAVRLSLHVLAAAVWVGGQIVMTGLIGPARELGGDAPKALARAFSTMAWPAFAILVVTGFWNISAVGYSSETSTWKAVLMAKVAVVVVAGGAAFLHQRATTKSQLALWGSVAGTASVVALVMGVFLAG